jgi:hypothetical protein
MTLLLDAGAFIAVERDDRNVIALIKRELNLGRTPLTHAAVVGQIWRGGSGRQAGVARLLRAVEVAPVDDALGRRAGLLLRSSKTRDVVDAALVLLARDGDEIVTSDADDLIPLAVAAEVDIEIVPV